MFHVEQLIKILLSFKGVAFIGRQIFSLGRKSPLIGKKFSPFLKGRCPAGQRDLKNFF